MTGAIEPEPWIGPDASGPGVRPEPEILAAPGTHPLAAAALSQYLVGRALAMRVSISLTVVSIAILLGAGALWVWGPRWLAVIVGLLAVVVALLRALFVAILRGLLGVGRLGPAEDRVRALVANTDRDLRRELRRIGLPGSTLGLPLLAVRLLGRRRSETVRRLAQLDVTRVVPRSRGDELAFVLRNDVLGRPRAGP